MAIKESDNFKVQETQREKNQSISFFFFFCNRCFACSSECRKDEIGGGRKRKSLKGKGVREGESQVGKQEANPNAFLLPSVTTLCSTHWGGMVFLCLTPHLQAFFHQEGRGNQAHPLGIFILFLSESASKVLFVGCGANQTKHLNSCSGHGAILFAIDHKDKNQSRLRRKKLKTNCRN